MHIRKFLFILAILLVVKPTHAQVFIDTIYFNATQEKADGLDSSGFYRVITNDTSGSYQFLVNDYYSNGQLKMSGKFQSLNPDKRNGAFSFYYTNGQLSKQCVYQNNKLEGRLCMWYENGNLKQECTYLHNKLTGALKTWSADGKLTKYAEYKDGKKHGKFITYYANGKPVRKEKYTNDALVKGRCYTANGNDTVYFIYFTPPSFLGGDISDFTSWVMEKLQYPVEANLKKEEGEVKVKFTIDESGNVKAIQITKQDRPYFNSEVLRVIASSPVWKPAVRDTDSVEVTVEIPVKFKLPGQTEN